MNEVDIILYTLAVPRSHTNQSLITLFSILNFIFELKGHWFIHNHSLALLRNPKFF